MYNLSVNKLPESLTPAVGGGIIDYESPNLDYAYNSVFKSELDIHNYRIMPTQIKESMVLWYDIARQGCTNENMAENPVLRDLSGNKHDATCYNFNWNDLITISGGGGGIGAYNYYAITSNQFSQNGGIVTYSADHAKATVTKTASTNHVFWQYNLAPQSKTRVKIKITGLSNSGFTISGMGLETQEDGEYFLVGINTTDSTRWSGLRFDKNHLNQSCNITIEQLTIYPHALISNGIDNYCLVEGLPLLNKENGYTVIAKRKWLDENNEGNSSLITKASSTSGMDGAFMFECKHKNATQKITRSFGGELILDNFYNKDITYQTSNSYNTIQIMPQDYIDTNKMAIFRFSTNTNEYYGKFALYSLLLFNRDLTPEEIEWVKRNLV